MPSKRGRKRARNPKQFTTDEAQTASLLVGEGFGACHTSVRRADKIYRYPQLRIAMCDKEALEPASRVFASPIKKHKEKRLICPRHLYPPDGKGIYYVAKTGHPAQKIIDRLQPLLTKNDAHYPRNLRAGARSTTRIVRRAASMERRVSLLTFGGQPMIRGSNPRGPATF